MDINAIKAELKKRKWNYEKLAKEAGISLSAVSKILGGFAQYPRVDTVEKILKTLDMNSIDFSAIPEIEPLPNLRPVPLLGTIACGEPILAEENIEKYVGLPEDIKADFALRCKGDSMINARIFDGDLVFIKQQSEVNNGEIAAVLIDNEATLKRVYKYPSGIELRPENPLFAPINITPNDKVEVKILGKAVSFLSKVV